MENNLNADNNAPFPPARRKALVSGPYLEIDFPESFELQFLTKNGNWMVWAAYFDREQNVERQDDGSYLLGGDNIRPEPIRCVSDHGEFFIHVDGGGRGEVHFYRLVPIERSAR